LPLIKAQGDGIPQTNNIPMMQRHRTGHTLLVDKGAIGTARVADEVGAALLHNQRMAA
jgi:hypothetical protein